MRYAWVYAGDVYTRNVMCPCLCVLHVDERGCGYVQGYAPVLLGRGSLRGKPFYGGFGSAAFALCEWACACARIGARAHRGRMKLRRSSYLQCKIGFRAQFRAFLEHFMRPSIPVLFQYFEAP